MSGGEMQAETQQDDELSPDAMQWEPGPTSVEAAAWALVKRCRRMLDNWSESTPEVRARDLWTPLHIASEDLANVLADTGDRPPANDKMHGPCGAALPGIVGGPPVFCSLRAGHDGWHERGAASWSPALAARPSADTETLRRVRELVAELMAVQLPLAAVDALADVADRLRAALDAR